MASTVEEPVPAEGSMEEQAADKTEDDANKPANRKPRQCLVDRCDGEEKVMDPDSRPCCAIFYAPLLLKFFLDILEQNRVMECLGNTGVFSATNQTARKWVMTLAFLSTIVGWGFLIFADFAISTQYDLLEAASFNYGSVTIIYANETIKQENATRISLGLRSAAVSTFSEDLDLFRGSRRGFQL